MLHSTMKTKSGKDSRIPGSTVKGRVNLQVQGTKIYYNFPTAWFDGRQVRKSSDLTNTPEGLAKAESLARQMEIDYLAGTFDPTLEKYKIRPVTNLLVYKTDKKPEPTLLDIWEKYLAHKESMVAETTFKRQYQRTFTNALKQAISADCKTAQEVRNYLANSLCNQLTVKLLGALSEAYTLAVKTKLVTENPYLDMAKELRESKAAKHKKKVQLSENSDWETEEGETIRAFSVEERDAIISCFENTPSVSHWANYVKFLFWTGCRPGEAAALRWRHIIGDCERIVFDQSYDSELKVTKSTKTYVTRFFPCSPKLRAMLKSIKPENVDKNDLVLKSKSGKQIDKKNFWDVWSGNHGRKGVIEKLITSSEVKQYLKPYATRHTFITHQIRAGKRPDVIAAWVGNSVDVIFKHYYQPDTTSTPDD